MSARVALVLCALSCLHACNREERARHEELGKRLAAPVALLCDAEHDLEGGGCYRDCQTRLSALEGHAAFRASEMLATIATIADPKTEALLEDVRVSARPARQALGAACSEKVDPDAEVTPAITTCSETRRQNVAVVRKLMDAVRELAAQTKARTGVALPHTPQSCTKE